MQSIEEWRSAIGYEGRYEVSSHGRVRSVYRTVRFSNGRTASFNGRMLKAQINRGGYPVVNVYPGNGGKSKLTTVHKMVALAFIGPRPDGHEVCHGDGNRMNNSVENLRWGTPSENAQDRIRHGNSSNHRRSACHKGHEYTEANTYVFPDGTGRYCRACSNARSLARNIRRRMEKAL